MWLIALVIVIFIIAIILGLQAGIVFLLWNYLVVWAFPTIPTINFVQSIVLVLILDMIRFLFNSKNKK